MTRWYSPLVRVSRMNTPPSGRRSMLSRSRWATSFARIPAYAARINQARIRSDGACRMARSIASNAIGLGKLRFLRGVTRRAAGLSARYPR
ncbi:Uncharacterised protein [Mycobacteroides abscessus subsp. abscessus]|nr:Uncharacterised protein [Mycobacteroides abscessus subsp. abscessus]